PYTTNQSRKQEYLSSQAPYTTNPSIKQEYLSSQAPYTTNPSIKQEYLSSQELNTTSQSRKQKYRTHREQNKENTDIIHQARKCISLTIENKIKKIMLCATRVENASRCRLRKYI